MQRVLNAMRNISTNIPQAERCLKMLVYPATNRLISVDFEILANAVLGFIDSKLQGPL